MWVVATVSIFYIEYRKMPYKLIRKGDGSYEVKNMKTGHLTAKHTTKAHAEAQIRLLHLIESRKKR